MTNEATIRNFTSDELLDWLEDYQNPDPLVRVALARLSEIINDYDTQLQRTQEELASCEEELEQCLEEVTKLDEELDRIKTMTE